jgi:hypothetical protein
MEARSCDPYGPTLTRVSHASITTKDEERRGEERREEKRREEVIDRTTSP